MPENFWISSETCKFIQIHEHVLLLVLRKTQIVRRNMSQTTWQFFFFFFLQGSGAATELLPGSSFTAVYHQPANITSRGTINGRTPKKSSTRITLLMTEQHRLHMATCEAARCVCLSLITCGCPSLTSVNCACGYLERAACVLVVALTVDTCLHITVGLVRAASTAFWCAKSWAGCVMVLLVRCRWSRRLYLTGQFLGEEWGEEEGQESKTE